MLFLGFFSTLLAAAAFGADRVAPVKGGPEIAGYECLYYPIPYQKLADSIWDCAAGPDGKIYIGMCSEHSGGSAHLIAFDPVTETFEDVFDAQELTKSPMDKMPQGKIHFTLNAHPDGRLFGATHFGYLKSTPDEPNPNPKDLGEWNDLLTHPERGYPGGHLFVYDTKTKQSRDLGVPIEYQGVRVMALDKTRGHLYGLGALDNYLFHHDIKAGKTTIVGKVARYNPYGMVVDERDGTMYTSDGTGRIIAYRAGWPKIKRLPVSIPGKEDPEMIVTVFITGPDGSFYGVDHVVQAPVPVRPEGRPRRRGDGHGEIACGGTGLLCRRIARLRQARRPVRPGPDPRGARDRPDIRGDDGRENGRKKGLGPARMPGRTDERLLPDDRSAVTEACTPARGWTAPWAAPAGRRSRARAPSGFSASSPPLESATALIPIWGTAYVMHIIPCRVRGANPSTKIYAL